MATEIGIVMSLYDKVSPNLKAIAGNSKAFDKTLDELEKSLSVYDKSQATLITRSAELKKSMADSSVKVKDARKAYKDLNDEVQKKALSDAVDEQTRIQQELKETETAIRSNNDAYKSLYKTAKQTAEGIRAEENRADSAAGTTGLMDRLKDAGLYKMLGDSVSQLAEVGIESMIGQPTASFVSSIISGVASGAAMGSIAGSPAIGAAVGGISGLAAGGAQVVGAQDDAFKSYYTGLYDTVSQDSAAAQSNGSSIAGGRESTRLAFNQLMGGTEEAEAYLRDVQKLAVDTNYTYDEITGYTKKLLNSFEPDDVLDLLTELSDATAGLSLSSSDVDMFISGLNRMKTIGKATREYLNYFDERGLDTSSALSSYLGVDKSAVADLVSDGKISGQQAVEAIRAYIGTSYGGLSEALAGTFDAMTDNLKDTMDNIDAARGGAYNDKAKEGLGEDLEAYGGALGDAVSSMNTIIGEGSAIADNLSRRYDREAMSALTLGSETTVYSEDQAERLKEMHGEYTSLVEQYQDASESDKAVIAGQIDALKEEAQSMADSGYDASDMAQSLRDVNLDLIAAIRENTAAQGEKAYLGDYQEQKAKSVGMFAGGEKKVWTWGDGLGYDPQEAAGTDGSSHAYGLERVPYDGYAAVLHQGERVLTAREAREEGRGNTAGILITGNEFQIRQQSDLDDVAEQLYRKIRLAGQGGVRN